MSGAPGLRPGDLVTVEQVRALLPVSKARVYQLIDDGSLPHVRVATAGGGKGRLLVWRSGLEDYVRNLRLQARTPTTKTAATADDLLRAIEAEEDGA